MPVTCPTVVLVDVRLGVLVSMWTIDLALSPCMSMWFLFVSVVLVLVTVPCMFTPLSVVLPLVMCMVIRVRGSSPYGVASRESALCLVWTILTMCSEATTLLFACLTLLKTARFARLLFRSQLFLCTPVHMRWLFILSAMVSRLVSLNDPTRLKPSVTAGIMALFER